MNALSRERDGVLQPGEILRIISKTGGVATGVPCSHLGGLFEEAHDAAGWRYVPATSEGEAVAIACGVRAAERDSLIGMQNSGLGHAADPLLSLAQPYGIPVAMIVSHRGRPDTERLPQHAATGSITLDLLRLLKVSVHEIDASSLPAIEQCWSRSLATGGSLAIVVHEGCVGSRSTNWEGSSPRLRFIKYGAEGVPAALVTRRQVLEALGACRTSNMVLIATTGHTSRELFSLGDHDLNFYMTGSMGYAGAFALGLHIHRPHLDVVVLDGDGSALMHLGNMATVAAFAGSRYKHIVLDNGVNASTGGQPTASQCVSFAAVALALGYKNAFSGESFDSPDAAISALRAAEGPALLHLRTSAAIPAHLPRVTVSPREQYHRLRLSTRPTAL